MKTYDKQKLNECAKELFALCLEKGIKFSDWTSENNEIVVYFRDSNIRTFLGEYNFKCNSVDKGNLILPIWELIEKVKSL